MDNNHLDLSHEFPELKERISNLKLGDNHFKKLYDRYCEINRQIYKIENRIELASEELEHRTRKERLALKDELYSMLTAA